MDVSRYYKTSGHEGSDGATCREALRNLREPHLETNAARIRPGNVTRVMNRVRRRVCTAAAAATGRSTGTR